MVNRREFVKDSVLSGLAGMAGSTLLPASAQATAKSLSAAVPAQGSVSNHRVYARLLDPRENPDYARHHVQPPTWSTFDHQTQLATLRNFALERGKIVHYAEDLEKYTQTYELGNVIWPFCSMLYASNLSEVLDEIKRRNLFVFDIWGYVPGSKPAPGAYWGEFQPPPGVLEMFDQKLGDHWLGMDNGEQDGRYVGGYADQMYPTAGSYFRQYLNFHRFAERITDQLGSKMSALVSLSFGHYFLKEGLYKMIGAETAQALPNGQLFYVFIRGAGKQYGVPWFGNASVFNRWGYKSYGAEHATGPGWHHGPTFGTSLSLMKRLMYSQILYNSMVVCFESGWFYGTKVSSSGGWGENGNNSGLSPIGRIQQAAGKWVRQQGQPGAMVTPVALMLDFFAGWTFPRNLYTSNVYRVWGNLPYGPGDYLTDGVLDMLYPGYQDSSYFHDESGFLTPTPYGDSADILLSDAPKWLLARYAALVVAGRLQGGEEVRDKLDAYASHGGHLLITAGSLANLPSGLAGITVRKTKKRFASGKHMTVMGSRLRENASFDLHRLKFPKSASVRAEAGGLPAVVEIAHGKGLITVFASPFGVGSKQVTGAQAALADELKNQVDKHLAKPFPLLKHVRYFLDEAFRRQVLFEPGEGLGWIACRKSPGEYTLGVFNNRWSQKPLAITSRCGPIDELRELPLDQSEKDAVGYLPQGVSKSGVGVSGKHSIAGGDVRIFAVRVREEGVEEIAHMRPPARPHGRALVLRQAATIKQEVLSRPTFFEHYDSAVIDWSYLRERQKEDLQRESLWIGLQKLKLFFDLTSGLNLFPTLRLVDNIERDYRASLAAIEDVMDKMTILGSHDLILSLHRYPENHFTHQQSWDSFRESMHRLCGIGEKHGITLHLRLSLNKPPETLNKAVEFIGRVGAPNLRVAASTAFLLARRAHPSEAATALSGKLGLWVVDAPQRDIVGRVWTGHASIAGYKDKESLRKFLAIDPQVPMLLDGVYKNQDEEYRDVMCLRKMLAQQSHQE